MATLHTTSSGKKYVIVQRGDTLSQICKKYLGSGSKSTYTKVAKWNDIPNPNRIYVGQRINLYSGGSSSSSSSGTTGKTTKKYTTTVGINHFGVQSDTDDTVFVTWKWDRDHVKEYKIKWYYHTGDGVWFVGSDTSVTVKQSVYNPPSNAKKVKVKIKPVSKTHKKNKKTVNYWTAKWSTDKILTLSEYVAPKEPPTPTVEVKDYKLTASLDNLDVDATSIQFELAKNDKKNVDKKTVTISASKACSVRWDISAGNRYKVRARSVKGSKNKEYSDWSEYSADVETKPAKPKNIEKIKALTENSIYVQWYASATADKYTVEYTTDKTYFDSSNQVQSLTIDSTKRHAELTGLESGEIYYVRVCAVNDQGSSGWTAIWSCRVGKVPEAPTTWSSSTTVMVGDDLDLYWVHNSEDGSAQRDAQLQYTINNGSAITKTFNTDDEDDEVDRIHKHSFNTSTEKLEDGATLKWRVRTRGVLNAYSDWSTNRTVKIYAPPVVELELTDKNGKEIEEITSFPFYIDGETGPDTQTPIGYNIAISAKEAYETIDETGTEVTINKGELIYSKYVNLSKDSTISRKFSASNIDLENGQSYKAVCTVSMNSGLTAESSIEFEVHWSDEDVYTPDAEIGVDEDNYSAIINPFCGYYKPIYYKVNYNSSDGMYIKTTTRIDALDGEAIEDALAPEIIPVYKGLDSDYQDVYYCVYRNEYYKVEYDEEEGELINTYEEITEMEGTLVEDLTVTYDHQVYSGKDSSGKTVYFCMVDSTTLELYSGVTLAVYRREYDGTLTEIATGISNKKGMYIHDPHPALDYARYRIVATDTDTGGVGFYDVPAEPLGEKSIIIQWDEQWENLETDNEDPFEAPAFTGSRLRLPYNIDVSDNHDNDVELVEYIGRAHPVSYYGTQRGETATWNAEIDRYDEETLLAIRRLAIYMGDVYVREPSGSGYWANVSVSFSQKHRELTIPVTFNIARVEGGM